MNLVELACLLDFFDWMDVSTRLPSLPGGCPREGFLKWYFLTHLLLCDLSGLASALYFDKIDNRGKEL